MWDGNTRPGEQLVGQELLCCAASTDDAETLCLVWDFSNTGKIQLLGKKKKGEWPTKEWISVLSWTC